MRSRITTVVLLLAGAWPWLFAIPLRPTSRDAVGWITRGAPGAEGWLQWIFATRHFQVGYRPITAASYACNGLLGGFSAPVYRITDLGLHLGAGLLVGALCRRLVGERDRWAGHVATAVFLFHPLSDQIVPHLARRSFSLALLLALAGLVLACSSAGAKGRWGAAGLLTAALLSNEGTLPFLVMLPWLLRRGRPEGPTRSWWSACLPALVALAAAGVLRLSVVGGVGGYDLPGSRGERVLPIAGATLATLFDVLPPRGGAYAVPELILAAAGAALLVAWAFLDRSARLGASFVGVYVAFFSVLGVWFPRQVYLALPAFALLFAAVVARALRSPNRIRLLAPLILLAVFLGRDSPVLWGAPPLRVDTWRRSDRVLRDLERAVESTSPALRIGLVLPWFRRPTVFSFPAGEGGNPLRTETQTVIRWVEAVVVSPRPRLEPLLTYRFEGEAAAPRYTEGKIVVPAGTEAFPPVRSAPVAVPAGLDRIYLDDGSAARLHTPQSGPSRSSPSSSSSSPAAM